jgi:hypothetical protein
MTVRSAERRTSESPQEGARTSQHPEEVQDAEEAQERATAAEAAAGEVTETTIGGHGSHPYKRFSAIPTA